MDKVGKYTSATKHTCEPLWVIEENYILTNLNYLTINKIYEYEKRIINRPDFI
jgi:hypothetical protein